MAKKKEPEKTNECGSFMGVKGVHLYGVSFEFGQDSDSCQEGDDGQTLKVFTEDGGGGSYVCMETKRWAIDHDEIDKFAECMKKIVAIPEEL